MCANSSGVQLVRPALLCSLVDSAVSVLLCMALPANSGWARMSASLASTPASSNTKVMVCLSAASDANGRWASACSAIQGVCSYKPSSMAKASSAEALLSWSSV